MKHLIPIKIRRLLSVFNVPLLATISMALIVLIVMTFSGSNYGKNIQRQVKFNFLLECTKHWDVQDCERDYDRLNLQYK
jgi:hypothetical protein